MFIELLEKIVLHGPSDSEFHTNKNLQNLLILTAIKADPARVSDYLNRLDNYDGPDIARIAISDQYQLYEEAFFIYKKFKLGEEAITVLLEQLENVQRAIEFAEYWDKEEVWSILGRSLLDHNRTAEAIAAFLKAQDPVCTIQFPYHCLLLSC
jgi:clathrin heavy chain